MMKDLVYKFAQNEIIHSALFFDISFFFFRLLLPRISVYSFYAAKTYIH